jgi:hypothetical protein
MVGLLISAAILGVTISTLEEGDFPGWVPMILCVLAATIPAAIINALLPGWLFIVGLAVGAVCGGFAISALCGMSVKRACIAMGIYMVAQCGLWLVF